MKKASSNKFIRYFLVIFFLLTLTKIDFRFDEVNPGSFVDDAEYYYHTQTIAIDRDLDYSNQMPNVPYRNLNIEDTEKVLPVHAIGVGLFASPFMFLSNEIGKIINLDSVITFNYFIYSLIPILYLFLSIKLLKKVFVLNNIFFDNFLLYLTVFGAGVTYFAFERFSMSHVYEFFATSLILYLTAKHHNSKNINNTRLFAFFIPLLMFTALSIRWSNYFLLLIPVFYNTFMTKTPKLIYRKLEFLTGLATGLAIFLMHTKYLHGIYTLNPSDKFLMVESRLSSDYFRFFDLTKIGDNLIYIFKSFLTINFSQEFGLFYFSPILFLASFSIFYFLLKRDYKKSAILIGITLFPFFSTLVLNNPGYSYGYRYFYSIIPIFIAVYFTELSKHKILRSYLKSFSIFSLISLMMFETTSHTVLSSDYLTNSFGLYTKYVNPTYLSGVFKSIIDLDAYLNIIFTSFTGVFIIKVLNFFVEPVSFIEQFRTVNDDILNMIINSTEFSWTMMLFMILFLSIVSSSFYLKKGTSIFKSKKVSNV